MNTTINLVRERVDIIFLTHNGLEMSVKCLDALKGNTHHPFRLIWIDNGSEHLHYDGIRKKVEEFDNIIHKFEVNRFYARAINQGIILSDARYVVTLSNDVFVTNGWLTKLFSVMENNPNIGLLSPLTDNIGLPVCRADYAVQKWGLDVRGSYSTDINKLPERCVTTQEDISMFCSMIRKEAIEKIGLLDERFFILANDNDYCDRIRLAGFDTAVCLNCFVFHKHSVTKDSIFPPGSIARMAIKKDHQALLAEKRRRRAMTGFLG